jgi:hypothetical protein
VYARNCLNFELQNKQQQPNGFGFVVRIKSLSVYGKFNLFKFNLLTKKLQECRGLQLPVASLQETLSVKMIITIRMNWKNSQNISVITIFSVVCA